jgi:hypothetical protein
VWEHHWPRWRATLADRDRIEAAARLSVEVNLFLAGLLHRGGIDWRRLMKAVLGSGLGDWAHFVTASRIGERVLARLRAGFGWR